MLLRPSKIAKDFAKATWDCGKCIHQDICTDYEVTKTECRHFIQMPKPLCPKCLHREICAGYHVDDIDCKFFMFDQKV